MYDTLYDAGTAGTVSDAAETASVAAVVSPPYPGTVLQNGSTGSSVARMQKYLNDLRVKYPTLPLLTVDGKYGANTAKAVTTFQALNALTADGKIGPNTWNSIVLQYNALTGGSADTYPGIPLTSGMTGQDVTHMQIYLNDAAHPYTAINMQTVDGVYGANMTNATKRFQRQFGLPNDGVIGEQTWNKVVAVQKNQKTSVTTPYPGYVIKIGATGDNVRYVQSYVSAAGTIKLTVDGVFGSNTQKAVIAFQAAHGLTPDGAVGSVTWPVSVSEFNKTL